MELLGGYLVAPQLWWSPGGDLVYATSSLVGNLVFHRCKLFIGGSLVASRFVVGVHQNNTSIKDTPRQGSRNS